MTTPIDPSLNGRRNSCRLALSVLLSLACWQAAPAAAQAQFPVKPVKITVGFAPGGTTDIMTRQLAAGLQETWGQPVVTDNRPGAASSLAAQLVARSAPDGYSLLLATDTATVVLPFLRNDLPYNPLTELQPLATVGGIPLILVAGPGFKGKSFADLVAQAKANPDGINYGSNGIGAGLHIAMERMQRAAGIRLMHVPYKGNSQALPDLIGGRIAVMWDTVPTSLPLIREGKIVPLAIGSIERSPLLPAVPTMAELGYRGFESTIWMGIMGPANLPAQVVKKIDADLGIVVNNPAFKERMVNQGFEVRYGSTEEFTRRLQTEYASNKALFEQLAIPKQ